jgi:hypothetical protein
MNNLLTPAERKALINKWVDQDAAFYYSVAIGEDAKPVGEIRKTIRKVYNKLTDAQLISLRG